MASQNVHLSYQQDVALTVDNHEDGNGIGKNSLNAATQQLGGLSADEFQFHQGSGGFDGSFFGDSVGMVALPGGNGRIFVQDLAGKRDLTKKENAMSTDAGSPIAPRAPFPVDLPRILSLRMRRVEFEAPKLEHFESSLTRYKQAIEFIVETDGEAPIRAYGPALFIGNVEVSNSERTGKSTWRFLQFETERLKPGAPISWGWMKDPKKNRLRTEFRYEVEG